MTNIPDSLPENLEAASDEGQRAKNRGQFSKTERQKFALAVYCLHRLHELLLKYPGVGSQLLCDEELCPDTMGKLSHALSHVSHAAKFIEKRTGVSPADLPVADAADDEEQA